MILFNILIAVKNHIMQATLKPWKDLVFLLGRSRSLLPWGLRGCQGFNPGLGHECKEELLNNEEQGWEGLDADGDAVFGVLWE